MQSLATTILHLRVYPQGRHLPRLPALWQPEVYLHTPGGRRADIVIFADVHSIKHTIHSYTEQPLRVNGREIIAFGNT
jgi:hypothetical protein